VTKTGLLLRGAEVEGETVDVSIRGTRITAVGHHLTPEGTDDVLDCRAGALIPGLHDHHMHLLSAAAEMASLYVGPPAVTDEASLGRVLATAAATTAGDSWIRAVGYHESVAGELDRHRLDCLVTGPVRVQHRSGALWVLNSQALQALGIRSDSGRLYGADDLIRQRLGNVDCPSLLTVAARLASYGVTGVTDATPNSELSSIEHIGRAVTEGVLRQQVVVTGGIQLSASEPVAGVEWGPVKIVIADHDLPEPAAVARAIETAHRRRRPVAVHCVTAVALAIALAAWAETGVRRGDRVEHGSVISWEAAARVAEMGLTVVTQPGFVAERGDQYLTDVDPTELSDLYRCASLLQLGIGVGGSTDAPFGNLDPWLAIRAAIDRRTRSGSLLGRTERVGRQRALELFLSSPECPGGPPRRVTPSSQADLCLLDAPLGEVLADPSSDHVVATIANGEVIFHHSGGAPGPP
jgi:predicted amidohydrolase YtcJ